LANSGGEINAAVLLDVDYTKAIQETNKPVIVDPRPNRGNGEFSFFVAAPIRDEATGKTTAIFRTRVPMPRINNIFGVDPKRGQAFYLTDSQGNITASSDPSVLQKKLEAVFPNVAAQIQQSKNQSLTTIATENGKEQIFTYVPNSEIARKYGLSWSLVLARPKEIALAPQYQLLTTLLIGTAIVALMVAILAIIIANRATRPILDAADAVERIGQGDLETRLNIKGEDELALLGENINSMAGQIATLLDEQARAAEEQRRQKEELQERALELLEEVDPINEGDLTVRARVTEDDIGTIADSYNVTVNNLRDIVAKVQVAATNVSETTQMNEMSIKVLSKEALQQAERIAAALEQVKQMAESVRMVATNAEKAAMIAQQANQMVEEGEAAMDRTVGGINTIRETVAETRQKVKYLGESSQKITAVVNLISSFAAQTKLLAFNASIEANRAGQEGRGFAVVAEEVRSLAQQSAEASTEIEKLVAMIQGETNEVIEAMEAGTEQVVIGTKLVEETRQSLNKITAASTEINELVSAISRSTIQQASTSEAVTQTMAEVAESANKTAREADQVVSSFEELQKVAEELQQDTGRFKVS
jgi:methyl-accepting chemotaxis protein PixJ